MSKFESNLVGREINSIPPGIVHVNRELPDSAAIYTIHTVYADKDWDGVPMCVAELTSAENVADEWVDVLPKSVKVSVVQFDVTWNLLPEEDAPFSDVIPAHQRGEG